MSSFILFGLTILLLVGVGMIYYGMFKTNVPRETMDEKRFIKVTCKVLTKTTLQPVCELSFGSVQRPSQFEKLRASLVENNSKFVFLAKYEEEFPNLFPAENESDSKPVD